MQGPATIDALARVPSRVQLFCFSAVTWNPHRIHYDPDHARSEGYPDVLVQSHLHACFLVQALTQTLGPEAIIRRFSFQNVAFATAEEPLTCSGALHASRRVPDGLELEYELTETDSRGDMCARARATVLMPTAESQVSE